jgi:hypothetical protein
MLKDIMLYVFRAVGNDMQNIILQKSRVAFGNKVEASSCKFYDKMLHRLYPFLYTVRMVRSRRNAACMGMIVYINIQNVSRKT